MPILDSLSTWPVGSVSAAVITDDGVVEEYGDTSAVFALASVTKLLVAQAVLVAVGVGEGGAVRVQSEARRAQGLEPGELRLGGAAALARLVDDRLRFGDQIGEALIE